MKVVTRKVNQMPKDGSLFVVIPTQLAAIKKIKKGDSILFDLDSRGRIVLEPVALE